MTINELIVSGILESYVLGTASDHENKLVQDLCKQHPELIREIEAIEKSLILLAKRSAKPVNAAVRQKLMREISGHDAIQPSSPEKIIPLQQQQSSDRLKLYKFAVAASLLLFVTSFAYNLLLQRRLSDSSAVAQQLSASNSAMDEQMKLRDAAMKDLHERLHIVADPRIRNIALNGMNALAKNSVVVHWNTETHEVYFDAAQLPASPAARQYQLWAIVGGKPVSMGMIGPAGSQELFQKMSSVADAQAFAVTIEQVGGSAVPTMDTMCLLGNV